MRACVEMAKDWRTDRYLRRLEAMMVVADKKMTSFTPREIVSELDRFIVGQKSAKGLSQLP